MNLLFSIDAETKQVHTASNVSPTTKVTQKNLVEACVVSDNAPTNTLIYTLFVDGFNGAPTIAEIRAGNVNNRFKVAIFSQDQVQLLIDNAAALPPGPYSVDLVIRITFDKADLQVDRRVRVVVQVA